MIKKWASSLLKKVTDEGLVVMASPMRAFSEASSIIQKSATQQNPSTINYPSQKIANVPLPLITFNRGGFSTREFGRSPRLPLFTTGFTDESARHTNTALPPVPIWIDYTIDIWCKTQNIESQLVTTFLGDFDPYITYYPVDFGEPYGKYVAPIRFNGITDLSELEGNDMADRIIRHSLQVRVEGWKYYENETEFTNLNTVVDHRTSSIVNKPVYLENSKFSEIYIQRVQGEWMKMYTVSKGKLGVVPVDSVPDGKDSTIFMDNNQIFLMNGVILKDTTSNLDFLHFYSSKPLKMTRYLNIGYKYHPNKEPLLKPLVVTNNQELYLGGFDRTMFGQILIEFVDLKLLQKFFILP